MLDPRLLEILACPACDDRPPVQLRGDVLVCAKCNRAYPIENGIPIMLIEAASSVQDAPRPAKEVTS